MKNNDLIHSDNWMNKIRALCPYCHREAKISPIWYAITDLDRVWKATFECRECLWEDNECDPLFADPDNIDL
ncbi:hypothetical protein [Chamaesiphon polymorphus]|uniref:Uncharacterized protein n=1 Tax=Chamaesiphon polymorphus CCALA 037 TaxID=2107692 RepID=A0A2T1FV09_9CYAN|nr:hypothetical protein [Chamaesiphon polymorphus]PSB48822.1 hypothetical protein C7B77_23715 [Chamaesiphon polymorphus CCALA 037]